MNIDTLGLFIDVMRTGSFAEVARRRDVDPSSVSRVIAGLEREVGFRLFQRTTRRLAPTEAGFLYFDRIEPLIGDLERAAAAARDLSTTPSGLLRVTASVSFGQKILTPLLPPFRSRFPDLGIELILTDANLDLIAERIDLAVRLGPRPDENLIGARLMSTRYRVCASPAYLETHGPLSDPRELDGRDCLRLPFSGYRTRWSFRDAAGTVMEIPVGGSIIVSNPLALRQCAVDGLGPALLADWVVGEDLATGRLVDPFPDYDVTATDFDTAAWILYPSRSYTPLKVRVFIDFLREKLQTS